MNLRHLQALAAIARLGSVSRAAQAISITQPAITQGLAKIEALLGEPMFERRPHGMVPTPAAALLAPRVDAALAHIGSSRVTMTQVRALLAVADAGSYAVASARTGLSQPSLHRAVADLSVSLRRPLIERRGRGTVLTGAGRRTLRGFRLARAELKAGLSEVAVLGGQEVGRVAIGAMPLSRARVLPAAITGFHRAFPEMEIRIVEGSYGELAEQLRDGDLDLMIGALRGDDVADLTETALFEDRPVVIGRKGHPAANRPNLVTLARYPWTVAGHGTPLRTQWERMFADAGLPPPPVPVECGSVITIRQMLIDSDFLTLLSPDQLRVELDAGLLVKLCDAPPRIVRTIGMIVRTGWRPTVRQAAFIETLKGASGP